jgi:hypothetical protein
MAPRIRIRLTGHAALAAVALALLVAAAPQDGAPSGSQPAGPPPPAPPPAPAPKDTADADAIIAIAEKHFEETRKAFREFHANYPLALTATVQEQRLRDASSGKPADWRCQAELRAAIDKGNASREAMGKAFSAVEGTWRRAKDTARRVPEGPRQGISWMRDEAAVSAAIRRASTLKFMVAAPASRKINEPHLATLWTRAQEYARDMPTLLPSVKAESLVPEIVSVPCIGEVVRTRRSK